MNYNHILQGELCFTNAQKIILKPTPEIHEYLKGNFAIKRRGASYKL